MDFNDYGLRVKETSKFRFERRKCTEIIAYLAATALPGTTAESGRTETETVGMKLSINLIITP